MQSLDQTKPGGHKAWSMQPIVNAPAIEDMLRQASAVNPDHTLPEILNKAKKRQGLTPFETAVLLCHGDHEPWLSQILESARLIKEAVYGKRIVFFAPLYLSNHCVNNCLYCAYRRDNTNLVRKTLSAEEIAQQVRILEDLGHKRLLLVAGEDQHFDQILQALKVVYQTRKDKGEIRRANVNIAPPTVEQFEALKAAGIGTYQCFQETYHEDTYQRMHPSGPKADFDWRLTVMDRAIQAGVDDVSTGVLLGLYDFRFDVTALIIHGQYLDQRYGVGPHAVSVPRLKVAHGTPLCEDDALQSNRYLLNDQQFKLVVAAIRLALPYTGLILSTRESAALRHELMNAGVSQVSAGSHTDVGGYSATPEAKDHQFEIEDTRSLEQVVNDVIESGNLSSFCTACYRTGRTGEVIMDLLKPGTIKNYCLPNAILTFQEYLIDYAQLDTRVKGEAVIARQLLQLSPEMQTKTIERLEKVKAGIRDLYF